MSKLLLFSDIHIHAHKNSVKRLEDCLEALEWVASVACEKQIKNVLFLGDLFQDRQKIQVLAYKKTYDIIRKYSKLLNFYLLLGNHDLWFADDWNVSSVAPFDSIENVKVIEKPCTLEIDGLRVDFLPYTKNPVEITKKLLARPHHGRILCGHIALDGAKLNRMMDAEVSVEYEGDMVKVDADVFQGYERVFLGHYHMPQKIGIVEYVGSPLQLNFGEAHDDKHVMILDTEDLSTRYIENTISPKHYIVNETELGDIDVKNAFVRIDVEDITAMSNALDLKKDMLENKNALSVEFRQIKKENALQVEIAGTKEVFSNNQIDIIRKLIDAVCPENLSADTLLEIGVKLWEDSQTN